MKRRRLPSKPEPPPEGFIYHHKLGIIDMKRMENAAKIGVQNPFIPSWDHDRTYNLRSSRYGRKRRT